MHALTLSEFQAPFVASYHFILKSRVFRFWRCGSVSWWMREIFCNLEMIMHYHDLLRWFKVRYVVFFMESCTNQGQEWSKTPRMSWPHTQPILLFYVHGCFCLLILIEIFNFLLVWQAFALQLPLFMNCILFLSREGFRRACLRNDSQRYCTESIYGSHNPI